MFRAGLLLLRDLAPRNLCGALLPCACTQQFSGVRQPCAIKRGGGFPLQCVLGVAALLSPTWFLRVSVELDFLDMLDAEPLRHGSRASLWTRILVGRSLKPFGGTVT